MSSYDKRQTNQFVLACMLSGVLLCSLRKNRSGCCAYVRQCAVFTGIELLATLRNDQSSSLLPPIPLLLRGTNLHVRMWVSYTTKSTGKKNRITKLAGNTWRSPDRYLHDWDGCTVEFVVVHAVLSPFHASHCLRRAPASRCTLPPSPASRCTLPPSAIRRQRPARIWILASSHPLSISNSEHAKHNCRSILAQNSMPATQWHQLMWSVENCLGREVEADELTSSNFRASIRL